jgi:hypothetical protein
LTDVEVQAVVDGEASEEQIAHADECDACLARVDERRASLATLSSLINENPVPSPTLETRLRHAMTDAGRSERTGPTGSTVLRATSPSSWRRVGLVSALATAAVIALLVWGVLPQFGAPTTLSANEILGRSLQTISNVQGVERLEYEVNMDGMTAGPVVIRQVIDRDNPHRYKVESYTPDGTIATALSQDPIAQRRSQLFHVDGTNYIVRTAGIHSPVLSMPQMAQALVETAIGIMQAKSDQQLTIEDGPNGRQYIIEIPPVTPKTPITTLDLFSARAVISGSDFRIQEFEATGTMLRQPFSISVKLRTHEIVGPAPSTTDVAGLTKRTGPPSSFEIEAGPDDVVLEGQAADDPVTELMTTVLRELGRARGR